MDSLTTHPSNAQQARAFTATSSLSFPGGAGDLTPPNSEKEAMAQGAQGGNGMNVQQAGGNARGNAMSGNGVTPASPATPAATPGATTGSSGIVPTLQ
jgi:transcription initiation factor TFIID TATA-box-binding protein